MKKLSYALAAAFLVMGFACKSTTRTGAARPTVKSIDFKLPQPNGEMVSLSSLKGQVVLVDMWATWCAPCKVSFPFYNGLQKKYADQGFKILAISVDEDDEAVTEFLKASPVGFTVLRDPEGTVPEQLNIETMPTAILIAKDGSVAFMHAGFVPEDEAEIEKQVKAALGIR